MRTMLEVERYGQDKSDRLNRDAMEHRMSKLSRRQAAAAGSLPMMLARWIRRARRKADAEAAAPLRALVTDHRG